LWIVEVMTPMQLALAALVCPLPIYAWVPLNTRIARAIPHTPLASESTKVASESTSGAERGFDDFTPEEQERYLVQNMVDLDVSLLPEIDVEAEMANEPRGGGDMNGLDDPREAAWRLKGEDLIRAAVAEVPGVLLYDITWNIGDLLVMVEPEDAANAEGQGGVGLGDIVLVNKAVQTALDPFEDELEILARHELVVSSRGAPNVLTCEREFAAFKGYEVELAVLAVDGVEPRSPIFGSLVGRDVHETTVNVKGRMVKVPNYLVASVTLPEAMEEPGGAGNKKKKKAVDKA